MSEQAADTTLIAWASRWRRGRGESGERGRGGSEEIGDPIDMGRVRQVVLIIYRARRQAQRILLRRPNHILPKLGTIRYKSHKRPPCCIIFKILSAYR
jgi:hypothetical protein